MIRKTFSILFFIVCSISSAFAQQMYPLKWEEKPTLHNVEDKWKKQSAAIVLDHRRIEYKQDYKKDYYVYRTIHRIIRVLDDKGVEAFNKYTIPTSATRVISDIKARTILSSGKVIDVPTSAIRTVKNEKGNEEYLFAMEGVEKGAEVEVMYTERKSFAVFGMEVFQSVIPVLNAKYELIVTDKYSFTIKGYNGFPSPKDSIADYKHFYTCESHNIEPIEEEEYGNADILRQRVDYKLSFARPENDGKPERKYTWNDLVENLHKKFLVFTDKDLSIAKKYLKTLEVNEDDNELTKIRKIEQGLKTDISISEDILDPSFETFQKIVEKKITTEDALARFMFACFTAADIHFELGLTASRYEYMIDPDLELWSALDEFIVYFPKQQQYLSPTRIYYRTPYFPHTLAANKGVFCHVVVDGKTVSTTPDIRELPALPETKSLSGLDANVVFDGEMVPTVDLTHSYSGFLAVNMRPAFVLVNKDKEKDIIAEIMNIKAKPEDISEYNVMHKGYKNFYKDSALTIYAKLTAPQLIEKAGPKYLFNVGVLLGPQQQLYKDEERKLPIDVSMMHTLPRKISIKIPQGYKVANPEALKINITDAPANGKPTMGFVSDYKINGDVLEININEYYGQLQYPKTMYPTFRKVINAAADFNKIVLILQKI
jgi:hypothetical protein